jgi:DNA-binding transcriptional ArsR family regulator
MTITSILRNALWACYTYTFSEHHLPADQRIVCFSWVQRIYQREFGHALHNTHLRQLATLGLLEKVDTSRQGNRRYYRLTSTGLEEARRKDCAPFSTAGSVQAAQNR